MLGCKLYKKLSKYEPFFLFLDYDGTLVETTDHPENAWPHHRLTLLLQNLCTSGVHAIAIISGRPVTDLEYRFPFTGIWLVGSHGAEISDKERRRRALFEFGDRQWIENLTIRSAYFTSPYNGCFIERKPFGVAFHFRQASSEVKTLAKAHFLETYYEFAHSDGVEIMAGDEVLELRPAGINKGLAVSALLDMPDAKGLHPVYFGNDTTDEDAFSVLSEVGDTIRVGNNGSSTIAQHKISDPRQVCAFLEALQADRKTMEKTV
jgi:trehalose 6-phosphate phosphatase